MNAFIRGLIIWFISTLFVVYAFSLNTAGAVFADTITQFLHLSDIGGALAVGSFVLGFACMQIPGGYLLDRFSIRMVVSGALFLLALGNFVLTFAKSLPLFAFCNFVQGLGASFAFIAVGKLLGEWFAPKLFPVLFGLTQTLSCVLAAIIHYFLVKALTAVSWQQIYGDFALFGFGLLIFTFIFVKNGSLGKKQQLLSFEKSISLVFYNRQIWLASAAAASSFGVLLAYASYWYMPVQKYYALDLSNPLLISGMIFFGIGVGTPFFGWLSNKVQSRRIVIQYSVILGTIFLIMGLYLPPFSMNNYIVIKAISFCIGFFLSGSMLYYTCVSETSAGNSRAVALGLINSCVFVCNTLLLFIPQLMMTKASTTYHTYLWVLPACLLLSILLSYSVKETYAKK